MKTLRDHLQASATATSRLLAISEKLPDLRESRDRWNQIRYASRAANAMVTDYEAIHSCGCCDDAAIHVWPYVEIEGQRIYSDPPDFVVGHRREHYGADLYPDWESQMRKAGIPEQLIVRISEYLESRANYRDDEEEIQTPAEPEENTHV